MFSLRIACLLIHLIAQGASGWRIWKPSNILASPRKGADAIPPDVDDVPRRDLKDDAFRHWKVATSDFDYDKVRHMKGSEVWRIVEEMEEALEKLEDNIKSRLTKVQEEKKAVTAKYEKARSQINANRNKYKSEMSLIKVKRDDAKELRNDIRKVKADIFKRNTAELKMSDMWRIVEKKEAKLKVAEDEIESRWSKVQKKKTGVEKDWQDALAQINTRRDTYKAEMEAVGAQKARASKQRKVIRELKKTIFAKK